MRFNKWTHMQYQGRLYMRHTVFIQRKKVSMNSKDNWLLSLSEDRELWVQEILNSNNSQYPSMIVLKYRQLYDLVSEQNIYGILFAAKDLFEVCVKIPVLMALVVIRNNSDLTNNKAYIELMSYLVKQPLSSGDWRAIARHIHNNNDTFNLPDDLSFLLRNTCRMLDLKIGEYPDAIAWRNKTIGHGMIRFEGISAYKNEIKAILEHYRTYFGSKGKIGIGDFYKHLYFMVNEEPITGGNQPKDCLTEIKLKMSDASYQEKNYVLNRDEKILFFESYNRKTKKTRYYDYRTGIAIEFNNSDFEELYSQYVTGSASGARSLDTSISHKHTTKEQDIILEYLHFEDSFIRPDFLIDQLEDITDNLVSGIIGLQMERGMGKSCLTSRMDTLYNSESLIEFAEVRTFHLNNPKYTTNESFINAVNENFKRNFNHMYDLRSDEEELPMIKLDNKHDLTEELEIFLKNYKSIYGCEKLLFILDGIDELSEQRQIFLKRLLDPNKLRLSPGCFVLVTSRLADEDLDNDKKEFIKEILENVNQSIIVSRNDDSYRAILQEYLIHNIPVIGEQERINLLSFCEYRFLYLTGIVKVWDKIDYQDCRESFFDQFIKYVFYLYKGCEKQVIMFLVSVAIFGSITIKDYVELFCGGLLTLRTLGIVNDIAPLLKESHSQENSFEFANEMYHDLIIREFFSEVFKDNKHIFMNALFESDNAKNFRDAYVNMAKNYPLLRTFCEQSDFLYKWNSICEFSADENTIIKEKRNYASYSEVLYWACERLRPEITIQFLEDYVYNIDAIVYWNEKYWSPDEFLTDGETMVGNYSYYMTKSIPKPYRRADKLDRLYCSKHVLLLMKMYHSLEMIDKLEWLMRLTIKNVQMIDKIVRRRTNHYNFFEDNISQEAYIECVEREYDLIAFRKKLCLEGEYEHYIEENMMALYFNIIESKLTTGHRKGSFTTITTTYPDSVISAVKLYLDFFMKR